MGKPLDWRRVETELEQIARSYGFALDEGHEGDKMILFEMEQVGPLNLTELAKELAERLA